MKILVDGRLVGSAANVDNDGSRLDRIKLGAVSELDPGTSGTYCFDAFASRCSGAIGLESGA